MHMIRVKIKVAVVLPIILIGASPSLYALQVGGNVNLDLEYTDNAALTNTGEVDDVIARTRLTGTISEDSGPVTGNATAEIRRLDYLDKTFADETYLDLDLGATWIQVRNRLVWNAQDHYKQTLLNNLNAATPSNIEDTNAFRLSADATFPLANQYTLTVTPSFTDYYYETSGNDNRQLALAADLAYQLDPTISLSLNGSFTDLDFKNDILNSDSERTGLNIAVAVTRARSRYNASIGATRVENDQGAETDGVTGSLDWEHDITGRSTIVLHASSAITDPSSIFISSSINPNTGSFSNVQNSGDTVRDNVIRVTYNRQGSVVNSSVWTELRDLDYETAMLDREVQEVSGNLSYAITSIITGTVIASYIRIKDLAALSTDKTYFIEGKLAYSLSRKLNASVGLRGQSRDSSGVASREYDALGIFANIGYLLGR